jgi:hypothetical protein
LRRGEFSAKTWVVHQTRTSRGAAAGHMTWARRATAHSVVAAALGDAVVSESWARVICQQTDRLPAGHRDEADAILLAARPTVPVTAVRARLRGAAQATVSAKPVPVPVPVAMPVMRGRCLMTGRCGWPRPSAAPRCWPVT